MINIKFTIENNIIKIDKNRINNYNSKYLRNLQISSDSLNLLSENTIDTTKKNPTFIPPPKKSSGLSTGGIIAIMIPCLLLFIAATLATILCIRRGIPHSPMINPSYAIPPPMMESTLQTFQSEPEKNVVIQQPSQNDKQEIFEFNKVSPEVTRVSQDLNPNKQNENVIPIQDIVNINKPVRQITQASQSDTSPQISYVPTLEQITQNKISQVVPLNQIIQTKISQVVPSNQIIQTKISQVVPSNQIIQTKISQIPSNQIIQTKISQVVPSNQITKVNIPVIPEKIVSESVVVSQSQKLPDINTSQISASKVLPIEVLPKITRQGEVLPLKVLPTIEQGNEINSGFGIVSQINQNGQNIIDNYTENNQQLSGESYEIPQ